MKSYIKSAIVSILLVLLVFGYDIYADVSTTTCTTMHMCNASATEFTFSFPIVDTSDLVVILRTTSTGDEEVLTETTDYAVSATNNDYSNGGTVTTVQTYAATYTLTILRNTPDTQGLTLSDTGVLRLNALEAAYDKLTMLVQQLQEELNRSISIPRSESTTTGLDDSVNRADKNLTFDSSGNVTTTSLLSTGTANISAFGETIIDDADDSAFRQTVNLETGVDIHAYDAELAALAGLTSATDEVLYFTGSETASTIDLLALATSAVRMVHVGSGAWVIYAPDGTEVSQTGSTSDGLQEAIDYCETNQLNLYIYGGYGGSGAVITATATVTIKPAHTQTIVADSLTLQFTTALASTPGLVVDSMMACSVIFKGQIVYNGDNYALKFAPANADPVDSVTSIIDSYFYFQAIAYNAGGSDADASCVCFDNANSIRRNRFEFGEINGGNLAKRGVFSSNPASGKVFDYNLLHIACIHGVTEAGLLEGTSVAADGEIYGNRYVIGVIEPNGASAEGISLFGSNSFSDIAADNSEGTLSRGITLQASADSCMVIARRISGATTNLIDAGTNNYVRGGETPQSLYVTVDVTAAEIKALAATQKTLVAAPGANKVLKLIGCLLILDNGATNYDDAATDGNLYIKYVDGDGTAATGSIEGDGFIDCTADTMISVQPAALAATAASSLTNKALVLDNDGAEFTTGDGTLTVIVHYGVYSDGL